MNSLLHGNCYHNRSGATGERKQVTVQDKPAHFANLRPIPLRCIMHSVK